MQSLKNIDSAWQLSRTITILVIVCSVIVNIVVVNWAFNMVAKEREKIYVLDKGKSLILALSQDMAQNRPVEAKNHITMFHELFFTLSPDADAINTNIRRALHLIDKTGYDYYNDWQEADYYRRIISANAIQKIIVDSVAMDFENYPYQAICYATQTIVRQSNTTVRNLVTTCALENVQRSDVNPHGFLMMDFKVVKNEDVSKNAN